LMLHKPLTGLRLMLHKPLTG